MASRRRPATAITVLICGAALLAGPFGTGAAAAAGRDGGEGDLAGKTARQINDTALRALASAHSLRIRTYATADPGRIDLTLDRAGNCTGTISKGSYGRVDLVKRGKNVWMRPNTAYWKTQVPGKEGDAAARQFYGRYLHGTTSDSFLRSLATACDLTAFQKSAAAPTAPPAPGHPVPHLTKGKPTVQEGTRVLPVIKKTDGVVQTLYVTISGKHYPRKLTAEANHQTGTVLLSNYNKPVPTKTPPAKKTVDISVLENLVQGAQGAEAV
ncbi:hypothetical protein [Streptomyces gilvosporeus]|uniref:Lipoprotein n=1 Tax=Streptomyces gilvosporeus TaxID=553510 RepID=A0A1V0TVQ3_9ACTN|nr:hypothetical protein [Streptomyces gilvosporeus]ARF57036.1 hypothetical protein B1H19_25240 [Streptomyces gilvosporeus]